MHTQTTRPSARKQTAVDTPEQPSEISQRQPLTIFLTGAAAGVGFAAAKHLIASGHSVTALAPSKIHSERLRSIGALPVYADLSRAGEVRAMITLSKADVLVNLSPQIANEAPFGHAHYDAAALGAHNAALLHAAEAAGVQYVIYGSYTALYADTHGTQVSESAALDAGGDAFLQAAIDAEATVMSSALPSAVLRMGYTYGPESPAVCMLETLLRRGNPFATSDAIANWLHHDDAASAIRRLAEAQPKDVVLNLTDDHPISIHDFAAAFAAEMGIGMPLNLFPMILRARQAATRRRLSQRSVKASSAQARELLGWQPQYTVKDGLAQVMSTWRTDDAMPS